MAMKKIKPQYGKVVPPVITSTEPISEDLDNAPIKQIVEKPKRPDTSEKPNHKSPRNNEHNRTTTKSAITRSPNPFLQSKEHFAKATLTKIGYRMRTEYVDVLDIIKKMKKGGYTLEAVLDDALTHYFENSDDGREAIKKTELFYS